jgi:hypothetical protein
LAFSSIVAQLVSKKKDEIKIIIFFDMGDYQKSLLNCQFI